MAWSDTQRLHTSALIELDPDTLKVERPRHTYVGSGTQEASTTWSVVSTATTGDVQPAGRPGFWGLQFDIKGTVEPNDQSVFMRYNEDILKGDRITDADSVEYYVFEVRAWDDHKMIWLKRHA